MCPLNLAIPLDGVSRSCGLSVLHSCHCLSEHLESSAKEHSFSHLVLLCSVIFSSLSKAIPYLANGINCSYLQMEIILIFIPFSTSCPSAR